MSGFINTVVQPSMERFLTDIRLGTFDFVLTNPRDAQLLTSIRRISIWSLIGVLVGIGVLGVALVRLGRGFDGVQAAASLVVLTAGAVQARRWPVSIYPAALRVVLTFLVPVAFVVTVPAEAVVGRLTWSSLAASLGLALVIFVAARILWRVGVRSYSGASA